MKNIASIRREYSLKFLDENSVSRDPILQFTSWWEEALESELTEVNAMTLSTVDENGRPSSRIVLLKDYGARGFVFFTNYNSRKANHLLKNPFASLVFFWPELERQVRVEGRAGKLSAEENDAYFRTRPFESRIGALASPQSEVVPDREFLEKRFQQLSTELRDKEIACPPTWGGFCIDPQRIEFWQGRKGRLHDRICYIKRTSDWEIIRLAP